MQHLWQLLRNKVKTKLIMVSLRKNKMNIQKQTIVKYLWNVRGYSAFRRCRWSLHSPLAGIYQSSWAKLIKDRTISRPKSRPQILYVDSLAIYIAERFSDRTFTNWLIYTNANNCQVLVKCSWLKISEDSLGRDKTLHQTSHEHFSSVNQNDSGKTVVAFLEKQLSHSQGSLSS